MKLPKKIGICAYPLSHGKETGRGLERVIEQIRQYFIQKNIPFDFYDKGIIRNEWKAVFFGINFLRQLKITKNDCYLAVYPVSAFFPAFLKKRPLVTAVHDLVPFFVHGYDSWVKYEIKRQCIRYACLRSDLLIVSFSSAKKKITELFKIDPSKIRVIPYGVDHQSYYPDGTQKIKNRVAFLGEAKRSKGMDSLIRAFALVLQCVPDATLELASTGSELEEMKQLAAATLPEGSYRFLGFIPEEKMREFYHQADVFVFPSRYGFGLSALEAMACGTPSIIGSCLDSLDFISDTDLLVNPDDIKEISNKITTLLLDQVLYQQKKEQAVSIAKQFSWDRMSESYYQVCLEAMNESHI